MLKCTMEFILNVLDHQRLYFAVKQKNPEHFLRIATFKKKKFFSGSIGKVVLMDS